MKVTLQESYRKLVQYGASEIQDSIQTALAKVAGVSPLRVTNIVLSSSTQHKVDIWFVLLGRPEIDKNELVLGFDNKSLASLQKAFINLVQSFAKSRKLKLQIDDEKTLLVTSVAGSFKSVLQDDHLSGTQHLFNDSYSILSMAGLAVSMVVIGLLVGVLVGFLVWKKQVFPFYNVGTDQAPLLSGHMTDVLVNHPCYQGHHAPLESLPSSNSPQGAEDKKY